jgi:hypothetical protein
MTRADASGLGNQVHPLRSPVPSFRGKANRHPSARVLDRMLFWTTADLENKLLEIKWNFRLPSEPVAGELLFRP